jgi:hypothetical protein
MGTRKFLNKVEAIRFNNIFLRNSHLHGKEKLSPLNRPRESLRLKLILIFIRFHLNFLLPFHILVHFFHSSTARKVLCPFGFCVWRQ